MLEELIQSPALFEIFNSKSDTLYFFCSKSDTLYYFISEPDTL